MKKYSLLILGLTCTLLVQGQTVCPLTYSHYLTRVVEGNLGYASQKLNVSAVKADVVAAKVFNDPQLSFEYANNQDRTLQMGQSYEVGLTQTLSLGKRGAVIRLKQSESEWTEALLEDYFRHLRADATVAYYEVLMKKQLLAVKRDAYRSMHDLAVSDSLRLLTGKIMEVEAAQSRLEAGIMYNEVLQAETELKNGYAALDMMMGRMSNDTVFVPEGELKATERFFSLDELMTHAIAYRSDLVVAQKNTEVAYRGVIATRRERMPDVDLSVALGHNNQVRNMEAPAPKFNSVTVGVAFPLKFSALNHGAVRAAKFRALQAETDYQQARLQVRTEVMKAYYQFQSLFKQLKHFKSGLLEQAKEVLKGEIYSYNRGEIALLDVLNAQRTFDDVRAQYIETLYQYHVALVELEFTSGIWDIE
ncbi:MAG: TolC family protein [Bacteroides sp.]